GHRPALWAGPAVTPMSSPSPCAAETRGAVGNSETGLLLFVDSPGRAMAHWQVATLSGDMARAVVSAGHQDTVTSLAGAADTTVYLAPGREDDAGYVAELAARTGVGCLDVPAVTGLARWDAGLSILFNRCRHPKILCADGQVLEFYAEDLERARRKLELYEIVLGRAGDNDCWLIGMHGHSEFLEQVKAGDGGVLHALLEAGVSQGQQVSLLDTKDTLRKEPDLQHLQFLARRPQHPCLRRILDGEGLLMPPAPREA
ncbi:MAG: hypothetical protein ACE5IK_04260, partial [Acidobacteriota bacterium]